MKPPIRWYGAKTLTAKNIVALMPNHRAYVEPFAGSLAVFFAKSKSKVEVVNDLHSDLVNLYRVMREHQVAV